LHFKLRENYIMQQNHASYLPTLWHIAIFVKLFNDASL
jgi:hypothetical protein